MADPAKIVNQCDWRATYMASQRIAKRSPQNRPLPNTRSISVRRKADYLWAAGWKAQAPLAVPHVQVVELSQPGVRTLLRKSIHHLVQLRTQP